MNIDKMRPGMRVLIRQSTNTRKNQGMDQVMYDMVGKQKTISEFDHIRGDWVKFEGHTFFWDCRDISELPEADENDIKLEGEKSVFDPTELN